MQTLNWNMLWQKSKPNKVDISWALVMTLLFASLTVVFSIIDALDTYGAKHTISAIVGEKVGMVLNWLDGFEFTASVVTFLFWGLIGLIAYTVVGVLLEIRKEVAYERELVSGDYVNPAARTKRDIVKGEILNNVVFMVTMSVTVSSVSVLVFVVLPMLGLYARTFGLGVNIANTAYLVAAVVVLWSVTVATIWFGKIFLHRHVLFGM